MEINDLNNLKFKPMSKESKKFWKELREEIARKAPEYIKQKRIAAGKTMQIAQETIIG